MPGSAPATANRCRNLILAPHADDEVLGCYSFLGPDTFVLYFGIEDRPYVSRQQRIQEIRAAAQRQGFVWKALEFEVNEYRTTELISIIEETIQRLKPALVLSPQPSYNQDHRAVYDAAMVATRPHDENWFVDAVLLYEQPHSVLWKHARERAPNFFVPINIDEKVDLYAIYETQVRDHRSPELLRALACLRGAQIRVPHAEGFFVQRMLAGALS